MYRDFILRTFIASLTTGLVSGCFGCFVVWKRLSYLCDSMSHSSLLGVIVALLLGIDTDIGILVSCLSFAWLFLFFRRVGLSDSSTVLGIISYSAIAAGLLIRELCGLKNFNIELYMFGDLLSVTYNDLFRIIILSICVLFAFFYIGKDLLLSAIDESLAVAEGVHVNKINAIFTISLAVLVALSVRTVGVLFLSSMMILLPSSAMKLARSTGMTISLSVLTGILSVTIGVSESIFFDVPPGSSITFTAVLFFCIFYFIGKFRDNRVL